MIRATGEIEGRRTLFLGLEKGNVTRLKLDQPIRVDLAELGWGTGQIVILYKDTLAELEAVLTRGGRPYKRVDRTAFRRMEWEDIGLTAEGKLP